MAPIAERRSPSATEAPRGIRGRTRPATIRTSARTMTNAVATRSAIVSWKGGRGAARWTGSVMDRWLLPNDLRFSCGPKPAATQMNLFL